MTAKREPQRLISDEEIAEAAEGGMDDVWDEDGDVQITSTQWEQRFARRIESLVRQRLAEKCTAPSGTRYCGCACHVEGRDE